MDTIFALATARGKAGIAVLRISGPKAHQSVEALCGDLPVARRAVLRTLRWEGDVLDEALVLVFAEKASFTGEAMAELQVHGSIAVTHSLVGVLSGVYLVSDHPLDIRVLELNSSAGLTLIDASFGAESLFVQKARHGA